MAPDRRPRHPGQSRSRRHARALRSDRARGPVDPRPGERSPWAHLQPRARRPPRDIERRSAASRRACPPGDRPGLTPLRSRHAALYPWRMAQLGVVLATFGSAVTSDDVPAYMSSVRGGREASPELIDEFRRRYDLIGRSPLIDITHEQARALQAQLDNDLGAGEVMVAPGMLHSEPSLAGALESVHADGARRIVVVVLAPQYSPIILAGY